MVMVRVYLTNNTIHSNQRKSIKYLRIELGTWVEKKKCTAFSCAFLFLGQAISLQKISKKQVRCKWCDLKIQNN